MLAGEPEHCPAGDPYRQLRAGREEVGDEWGGINHMLEVVEDQQTPSFGEECGDERRGRLVTRFGNPQRPRDGRSDEGIAVDWSQGHEPDAVREVTGDGLRSGDGEARLAHPTGARQRQQANVPLPQPIDDGGDLPLAPDEGRQGNRQMGWQAIGRPGHDSASRQREKMSLCAC